jgi:ADP-ribose pyrophosphatase
MSTPGASFEYTSVPLAGRHALPDGHRVLEFDNDEAGRRANVLDHAVMDRQRLARTPWRRLTSRPVYQNSWIRVREDQVELPDGRTTIYGVVQCAGCVGVLPFLDLDTVVLVGQYRYVAAGFYWEMPTGAIKAGESEEAAVQRELAEEAGYEAARLVKLCAYHTSKSVVDETANIYLAEGLRPVARRADPTEFIEVRTFPFDEVVRMVERDEIKDSMTIIAVLHAARRRDQ